MMMARLTFVVMAAAALVMMTFFAIFMMMTALATAMTAATFNIQEFSILGEVRLEHVANACGGDGSTG